jgi:hypothetical protein
MKFQDQQLLEEAYKKVKSKKMSSKKKMMKEGFEDQNYSGYELLELWMEKNAVRYDDEQDLTNLVEVLGYRQGLREFFGDNPGAIEAVFNWVENEIDRIPDWSDNLRDELEGMMEDEEETSEAPESSEAPQSRQFKRD